LLFDLWFRFFIVVFNRLSHINICLSLLINCTLNRCQLSFLLSQIKVYLFKWSIRHVHNVFSFLALNNWWILCTKVSNISSWNLHTRILLYKISSVTLNLFWRNREELTASIEILCWKIFSIFCFEFLVLFIKFFHFSFKLLISVFF